MKVTRFADIEAYWTEQGLGGARPGEDVVAGSTSRATAARSLASGGRVGGMAWSQHTGI